MCLAVPGKIINIENPGSSPLFANIDSGGLQRRVCIDFLPDVKPGEYVIIHAGYALEKINQDAAEEQIKAFEISEKIIRNSLK